MSVDEMTGNAFCVAGHLPAALKNQAPCGNPPPRPAPHPLHLMVGKYINKTNDNKEKPASSL
jgi:hypothetical protein